MKKLLIITLLFSVSLVNAEVLTTGADFLKITLGGRNAGMGEATGAISDDIEALSVNVAGISRIKRMQFLYEHSEWFESVNYEGFAAAIPLDYIVPGRILPGVVAVGYQLLYIPQSQFPNYDDWGLLLPSNIGFSSFKLSTGYALGVFQNNWIYLSAGGTIAVVGKKVQNGDTDLVGQSKPGIDLGLTSVISHNDPRLKKYIGETFNASLLVQNIDFLQSGVNESLPFQIRAGLGFRIYNLVNLGFEGLKYIDTPFRFNIGLEGWIKDLVAIRAGTKLGSDQLSHFNLGFGVKYKIKKTKLAMDYALVPFEHLGMTHRFTLKADVGKMTITIPDKTDIMYYRGVDYFIQSDYENAIEMWEKVLKKNPGHLKSKNRLKEVQKIIKYQEKEKELKDLQNRFEQYQLEQQKKDNIIREKSSNKKMKQNHRK